MDQRQRDASLELVGNRMSRIGAEYDGVRTSGFEMFASRREQAERLIPIVPTVPLKVTEIEGIDDAFGKIEAAESSIDSLVDISVIIQR